MKMNYNLSVWRKILIAIFSDLALISIFLLKDHACLIIDYDSEKYYTADWLGESRIGNITKYDSRGYKLDNNWVNIGNIYWYSQDFEDVNANEDFGELIRLYSYSITDRDNPNYGENASLWIYDISTKLKKGKNNASDLYKDIYKSYTDGKNSMWRKTNASKQILALKSGPALKIQMDTTNLISTAELTEKFLVLVNNRIYYFSFTNDQAKLNGLETFEKFDKRCLSVLKRFDFTSYGKWKAKYYKYNYLKGKEQNDRDYWCKILLSISLLSVVFVFLLFVKKVGNKNPFAKKLAVYNIISFCLAIAIIVLRSIYDSGIKERDVSIMIFVLYIHYGLLCSIMSRYLSIKSNQVDNKYNLIPNWLNKTFITDTERKKRIIHIFLIYPLFFVSPLPIIGDIFLVFYILPVALIILIVNCAILVKGAKEKNIITNEDKILVQHSAKMFCRHCGKLIDSDSEYCSYCGRKL